MWTTMTGGMTNVQREHSVLNVVGCGRTDTQDKHTKFDRFKINISNEISKTLNWDMWKIFTYCRPAVGKFGSFKWHVGSKLIIL